MNNPAATVDDRQIAAKHRAMWASGDYPKLAAELVAPLGPVLVDAVGVGSGDCVLDVAAGTGNAAIPAAQTGASVVASDLCPELLEHGRVLAAERGVELDWREANETPWFRWRLGLLDFDQGLVGPFHSVERGFELCGR